MFCIEIILQLNQLNKIPLKYVNRELLESYAISQWLTTTSNKSIRIKPQYVFANYSIKYTEKIQWL